MNTSIKKIGAILLIIVLLPLIIYTTYELSSLTEEEKIIETIYLNQLNTIIFSVNQYTDDILQGWTAEIEKIYSNSEEKNTIALLDKLCKSIHSISLIIVADTSLNGDLHLFPSKLESGSKTAIGKLRNVLVNNDSIIKELTSYYSQGYNKIASLNNKVDDSPLLTFITKDRNGDMKIVMILLRIDQFINDFITSKINSIASEELNISIFHNQDLLVYTGGNEVEYDELLEYKRLWNFPNHYLGISTTGKTIKDISSERSLTNIIILGFLNVIILLGIWFLFVNIKKEIKLSQLKSEFVSNVSHEIRTPLSLIGMFAETLELNRVNSEEEKFEYYKIIRRESERLTRIVNSILKFSKMESRNDKYVFEKNNLNAIIDEVLETYQHELNNGKNICILHKHESLDDLEIDKEAVVEAIINLIDNALKYCEANCEIKISTGIEDNFEFIEVSDNGIGISKEDQKKIFDKFFRVSTGNVHNTKGSGLGLSLVKNIMEAHNGLIKVDSKLGKGSTFRLLFPINNKES